MTDQPTPTPPHAPPAVLSRRDLEARIIAKAWRDPKYKKALVANPKAVLQQEIAAIDPSVALPTGLKVAVHEEAPNIYHLVLPRSPKDITLDEIIGDGLEAVAPQTVAVVVSSVVNSNSNLILINAVVANSSFVSTYVVASVAVA
jgi:hypothetical protein